MSFDRSIRCKIWLGLAALVLAVVGPPAAATPLHPAHELEGPGLSVATAGAGLLRTRSATLAVEVRGPVALALLVWTGRGPCRTDPATDECGLGVAPFADQVLRFDGSPLTGEVAGFELRPPGTLGVTVGYVADVTDTVAARGPGLHSFAVADGDDRNDLEELEGVGLLVVHTDPGAAGSFRVMIDQGLDFAYGEELERGDSQATDPFSFIHGAAKAARGAELLLFAGGAEENRPDRVDVSHNRSVSDELDGSEGPRWDVQRLAIGIPGAVGTTSVQVFSEPVGENPDSISWVLAALRLPLAAPAGCPAAFWSAHQDAWRKIRPAQKVGGVFGTQRNGYQSLSGATLGLALRFKDGPGLLGAAKALLREGTAALLNALHPEVEFPLNRNQVTHQVGEALASRDPGTLLAAAAELAEMNAAGCPLD